MARQRTPVAPKVYSPPEAAAALGISRTFAYELIQAGRLPAVRLGRRWVVPISVVDQILESGDLDTYLQQRQAGR